MILTIVKGLHIAALVLWCAGLVALPLMLGKHRIDDDQADYGRLRLLTHDSYSFIVTPAAVIAIAAGTLLIYLRGVFEPWMFAKLVAVGLLVSLHALVGHTVILMSERRGEYAPPSSVPLRPPWPRASVLAAATPPHASARPWASRPPPRPTRVVPRSRPAPPRRSAALCRPVVRDGPRPWPPVPLRRLTAAGLAPGPPAASAPP